MQPYSDRFRTYRKVMHRVLGSKVTAARFNPLQEVEVRRFLLRVLDRPNDLVQHIRTYVLVHFLVLILFLFPSMSMGGIWRTHIDGLPEKRER